MRFQILLIPSVLITMLATGCQSTAFMASADNPIGSIASTPVSTTDGVRQVDTARWTKTGQVFTTPDDSALAANESRIVIFRTPTGVSEATSIDAAGAIDFEDSVVVGIENYFQTSLQAGRYSQIKVCAGQNVLSAELTDQKNNHLANDGVKVNLQPKRTYYYQVSHVEKGVTPVIRAINAPEAIELLKGSIEQTHQISRVVTDNCMQPPTQTTTTNPVTTPVMETQKPINLDVLFDFDSAQIKGEYQQKIQLLAEYMQANPEATVHLESHTDSKGAAGYNLKLSQARAEAVKAELVNNYEVAGNRITTQGYGESQPVASNDTEAGRQQNRRVLATIYTIDIETLRLIQLF